MKLRPARSARQARRSYLTAVTFRQHFPAPLKIIRLLNKRGFSFRWLRLVSRGCDGARVTPGVAKSCAEGEKGGSRIRYENTREKIFTDYYFSEANTANKSDKLHNKAINENLNWGGFLGCYTTPNLDSLVLSRNLFKSFPFVTVQAHGAVRENQYLSCQKYFDGSFN